MAISDELSRLITAKAGIKSALEEKGLTIGDSSTLDEFPTLILEMEVGGGSGDTSTLIDLIERDITSLVIPDGTTRIGHHAFCNCAELTDVSIPNTVTWIGNEAFNHCSKLKDVLLPNTITYLGYAAFANTSTFRNIIVPDSVITLENSVFNENPNVKLLVLGSGVLSCGLYIVTRSPAASANLNIISLAETPPTISTSSSKPSFGGPGNLKIYVHNTDVDAYKNAWTMYSSVIYPLASMSYDASTYTVTASGRDNVELYVDASLINSSVYTFVPDTIDVSHNITVKSVDPSLGILDTVSLEILIEGETLELKNYFALTAVQNSSVIFLNSDNNVDLKYSSDGVNWSNMTFGSAGKLNLPAGETIYFKGNNPNPATGLGAFYLKEGINASGNVMSLIYDENFENQTTVPAYAFLSLFQLCEGLRSVENLLLPATTLGENCYKNMFMSCSNITKAPELPALTLVSGCYDSMFSSCSKLNYIKAMFTTEPSDTYLRSWASGVAMEGTLVLNAAAEWDPMDYDMDLGDIVLDWTIEKVNA